MEKSSISEIGRPLDVQPAEEPCSGANAPQTVTVSPHIGRVVVFAGGRVIASSKRAKSVRYDAASPVIYVPEKDVQFLFLSPCPYTDATACAGLHFDVVVDGEVFPRAARRFGEASISELEGHVVFDETLVELKLLPVYTTATAASDLGFCQ